MTRRGFVLIAVLYALVLLAALTAGGFFAALQESRIGRNSADLLRAEVAGRSAIATLIAGWDPRVMDAVPVGRDILLPTVAIPGVTVRLAARRLSPRLFLARVTASAGGAVRSAATVLQLDGLEPVPVSAARTRAIDPALLARVSGVDRAPQGWTCPVTNDTITAVTIQHNATDSAFFRFGRRDWPSLVAWAMSIAPGGDSLEVRYSPGDSAISGGRGLGVLIVGGDLTLSDDVQLVGIVVVRGSVILEGSGGTVSGTLISSQLVAGESYTSIRPVVSFSSCAVLMTALSRAYARPLPGLPEVPFF